MVFNLNRTLIIPRLELVLFVINFKLAQLILIDGDIYFIAFQCKQQKHVKRSQHKLTCLRFSTTQLHLLAHYYNFLMNDTSLLPTNEHRIIPFFVSESLAKMRRNDFCCCHFLMKIKPTIVYKW